MKVIVGSERVGCHVTSERETHAASHFDHGGSGTIASPCRIDSFVSQPVGPPHVIKVRDLCKSYDGKVVIDHLSFTVRPGGSSRASSARTMPASRRRCASSSVSTDPLQGTPRSAASTTSSCSARCRVDEVLELVGLHDVAHERAGTFSLGIGQRLGLAAALIGDPSVLILDEPVNGLAPDGIM